MKKIAIILCLLLAQWGTSNAYALMPQSPQTSAITFQDDELEKRPISEVQFTGNRIFTSAELADQLFNYINIKTEDGDTPDFISVEEDDKEYNKEDNDEPYNLYWLKQDLYFTQEVFLGGQGYLKPKVQSIKLEAVRGAVIDYDQLFSYEDVNSKDSNIKWRAVVALDEGPLFHLGNITVTGDYSQVIKDGILSLTGFKSGEAARLDKLNSKLTRWQIDYNTANYDIDHHRYKATIIPAINDETNTVDLNVLVEKDAKKYTFRRIEFTGINTTSDTVMKRALMINEGLEYDRYLIERSLRALRNLALFDKVAYQTRFDEESGSVDIVIAVKEKPLPDRSY